LICATTPLSSGHLRPETLNIFTKSKPSLEDAQKKYDKVIREFPV